MSQAAPVSPFAPTPVEEPASTLLTSNRRFFTADRVLRALTTASAALILLMLAGLISVLAYSAMPSIKAFGVHFLVGQDWRPNEVEQPKRGPGGKVIMEDGEVVTETLPPSFGALPVIW